MKQKREDEQKKRDQKMEDAHNKSTEEKKETNENQRTPKRKSKFNNFQKRKKERNRMKKMYLSVWRFENRFNVIIVMNRI
eukprot:UN02178